MVALASVGLAWSVTGAASAQTPRTYGQAPSYGGVPASCRNAQTLPDGSISADCQGSAGYRTSTIRAADCRSTLVNRDGVLSCVGATATVGVPSRADIVGTLLGALFGAPTTAAQTLENDWSGGRRPLSERRVALDARIDAGVRNGSLTRREAERLRDEYDELVEAEARYAADGRLTSQERADLRTRFDDLSERVREERRDDDQRWRPLSERRAEFEAQVEAALRDRTLNRMQSTRLRSDFQVLVQLEAGYARNGIDAREEADLTARYDDLRQRLGDDADDYDDRPQDRWPGIERRIAAGERSGAIDTLEAARLRTELGDLTRLDAAYNANGLNAEERDYLTRRFGELSARVRTTRR
ncbi:hypothetical protein M9M90_06970 [Phenylobacterium sp. LH3H17]|uniref:hypothetical protein n=1 Tax=Phenylobacterium sp. LH3H17 TaxID=2903901 RepID=UPI0020C967DE|nr:hypothetical protein [Phenylobacterium sp. LH3H17]UTP40917.1 hypothetical protein M9M90_06970 [Phenylobacterium sp. LH3H17]